MIIKNCKIIKEDQILTDHFLKIKNGRIEGIYNLNLLKDFSEPVLDLRGDYIGPGLIDIHNHGNSGFDFMDMTEEALDAISSYHLKNGVSSFLGTVITSDPEKMIEVVAFLSSYENKSHSKLIGIHLEGPFFNKAKMGAQNPEYILEPSLTLIEEFLNIPNEKIKMVSLAPEVPGSQDIIEYLKSKGKYVALGHTNADFKTTNQAFEDGASIVTHLFNAMSPLHHRKPNSVGASLLNPNVYTELICDFIHVDPQVVKIALKLKGYEKIILVSDAMRGAGLDDGQSELGGQKVIIRDQVAYLENGSLAGSTLNLNRAIKNLLSIGVPLNKAINMASINPARALGLDGDIGSIEEGKLADLISFDSDFNLKYVFINGNKKDVS